jgi:hypothetical protein
MKKWTVKRRIGERKRRNEKSMGEGNLGDRVNPSKAENMYTP